MNGAATIHAHLTVIIFAEMSEGAADSEGVKTLGNTEIDREVCVPPDSLHHFGFSGAGLLEVHCNFVVFQVHVRTNK